MYDYISNQIAVYKTNKVLVEFRDKLKVASIPNYAHLHADGEQTEGAMLIDHALMAQNHLGINELTTLAYQNTFRLFPSKIQEIGEYYLNELTHDPGTKPEELAIALLMKTLIDRKNLKDSEKCYVLTSNVTRDGATALLNLAALKEFSDTLGYDLLILPGTNCGFVIQPWTDDTNLADVKKVVSEILETDDSDILTDQIFCYNRAQGKLELLE